MIIEAMLHPSLAATFSDTENVHQNQREDSGQQNIYMAMSLRENQIEVGGRERERTPLMIAYVFMIFL